MASSSGDALVRQLRDMGVDESDGAQTQDLCVHSPGPNNISCRPKNVTLTRPCLAVSAFQAVYMGARNVAEAFNLITERAEQQRWAAASWRANTGRCSDLAPEPSRKKLHLLNSSSPARRSARDWEEYFSATYGGRPYFCNKKTSETTWDVRGVTQRRTNRSPGSHGFHTTRLCPAPDRRRLCANCSGRRRSQSATGSRTRRWTLRCLPWLRR